MTTSELMSKNGSKVEDKRRPQIKQTDMPSMPLSKAVKVAFALADSYASSPTSPLNVALALGVQPTSGPFRAICGASIGYGLTEGGYNAQSISLTELGKQITRPTAEGQDIEARRQAVLIPTIPSQFLRKYDQSSLPKTEIAINVLQEMGVPRERCADILALILDNAQVTGLIKELNGKSYVDLSGSSTEIHLPTAESDEVVKDVLSAPTPSDTFQGGRSDSQREVELSRRRRKVFISHGKDKHLIEPIKELLGFGKLEAVVSVEKQTVSRPVPEKVLTDMRACGAAIIHVNAEKTILDKDGTEQIILNENVLIEIGAAMAIYGRRFVLLVKEGVALPSNLQGLYEVRYDGDSMDSGATIRLLKAIKDIENHPLPEEEAS